MTRGSTVPLPLRIVAFCLVVTLALPPVAFANPQGGAVRHGQVQIQGGPGQLQIRQMTQRAVIDWESFSIDQGELTHFIQPGASSAVLNRVRGSSASQIEGMLRANGRVYLINPNGILIGPNGSVDVAGFVASTLDAGDRDFLRGGSMRFSGASDAAVINLGSISALDGDVVLMGASVLNAGEIRVPRGTAALAAGNDILLAESGEERVFVRGAEGAKKGEGVTNTGNIEANIAELKAHGGNIYGIAVKNEGRVAATGVTRSGGQIFLSAGGGKVRSTGTLKARRSDGSGGQVKVDSGTTGKTEIGGTIDASGESGAGGQILILGNEIEVFDGTLILNDGETMGGQTFVGGGRHGADPSLGNATTLTVGNGSLLSANARGSGDGGEIVLFATDTASLHGTVSARGGAFGGNGGFIELSGQNRLFVPDLVGQVQLSAPLGNSGSLLLDPANINVVHGTGGGILGTTMTDGAIMDVLANFPVLIWTSDYGAIGNGDITFAADVNLTWSTPYSLTFQADRNMTFLGGARIASTGNGAFSATAERTIRIENSASISTSVGNLTLSANPSSATAGQFEGIFLGSNASVSSGTGTISLTGRGGNGTGAGNHGIQMESTATISSLGGNLFLDGRAGTTVGASPTQEGVVIKGNVTTTGNGNITIYGKGGNGTSGNLGVHLFDNVLVSTVNGDIAITGVSGPGTGSPAIQVADFGSGATSLSSTAGDITLTGDAGSGPSEAITVFGSGASIGGGSGAVELNATGDLRVYSNASVTATGAGTVALNATRRIALESGADVTSVNGTLSLSANASGTQTGAFNGIEINNSLVQVSGTGNLTVTGKGGLSAGLFNPSGVVVNNAGSISGGTSGTVVVSGTGGSGSSDSSGFYNLVGVSVDGSNSRITSSGANVQVTGIGGTSSGDTAGGVLVISSGQISAGGTGTVSVTGNGGTSPGLNYGIDVVLGGSITSNNGTVTVNGTGGTGTGALGENYGLIYQHGGTLSAGGTNALNVTGTGGSGLGGSNHGVFGRSTVGGPANLTSGGGSVTVTGIAGTGGTNNLGLVLQSGAGITTAANGGDISLISDTIGLGSGSSVSANGLGTVSVRQRINGVAINLGSAIDTTSTTLELSDAELDLISAGTVQVGNANSGSITVSNALSHGNHLSLTTGAGVTINEAITMAANKNLTVNALGTTSGEISLANANADLSATGTGAISLTTVRNLYLAGGSSVTTVNGNLTLLANLQLIPNDDDFIGVLVDGATVESTGAGQVTVRGKGGNKILPVLNVDSQIGVAVRNGGKILGGTTGTLLVEGTGRQIASGRSNYNYGVLVSGSDSLISSNGASVSVTGFGGDGFNDNYGVLVRNDGRITSGGSGNVTVTGTAGDGDAYNNGVSVFTGGMITSGGAGTVTVTGTGGNNDWDGSEAYGVILAGSGSTITSGGGAVSVTGYGGIGGEESYGVLVMTGSLVSSGGGAVSVTGEARNVTHSNGFQGGVFVINSGSTITSGGGNVTVNGTGATGGVESYGVILNSSGLITAGGTGSVSVTGTSGTAANYSEGVAVYGGSDITSNAGAVSVTGYAGTATGTFGYSDGIRVHGSGSTITSGGGNITIYGTGGTGGANENYGVIVNSSGQISAPGSATLSVTGNAGAADYFSIGVALYGGGTLLSNAGALTIEGTGGTVTDASSRSAGVLVDGPGSTITSSEGNVSVTGTGGISTTHDSYGVIVDFSGLISALGSGTLSVIGNAGEAGYFSSGVALWSGSDLLSGSGALTVEGSGDQVTYPGSASIGVLVASSGSTITSSGGNVSVTGTGGISTTHDSFGVKVDFAGRISATGSGTLSVTGEAMEAGDFSSGVALWSGAEILSDSGALTIEGTGSTATNAGSYSIGVSIDGSGSKIGSTGGSVGVDGTSGAGGDFSYGVVLFNDGDILGGNGAVSVTGTSGSVTRSNGTGSGVALHSGNVINSTGGNVSVTGHGGTGGIANRGVTLFNNGLITAGGTGSVSVTGFGGDTAGINGFNESSAGVAILSNGTITSNSGAVTVTGTGGDANGVRAFSYGVRLADTGATITSGGGNVSVTGTGGAVGLESYGVSLVRGLITSGGSGSVLVDGTGGSGLQYNEGVSLYSNSSITSGGGSVTVIGQGGTGDPLTDNYGSAGIGVYNTGTSITSGGGNVVVTGTGGIGPTDNYGIWIWDGGQIIGSTGTLSVSGTGGSDSLPSGLNHGILIEGLGSRITGSGGNLTVNGIGGSDGSASHGVRLHDRGEIVYSGGGLLTVEGDAGIGGSFGISLSDQFNGGAAIRSTGSGNILLIADSLEIASNTESIQAGTNTVTIRQLTDGHLINLGGSDTATSLGLSDAELDRITAGLVRIGNQNTGVFTVSSAITHGNHLSLTSGDWFDVYEGITMSSDRNLTLTTTESGDGYISLFGGNAQLSTAGTGAITLDVKRGIKLEYGGISTENGNLTLLANTADGVGNSSIGIELFDADLSTVNGAILLDGHPGPDTLTGDNDGIVISGGSSIDATGTGTITLTTPRNIRIESASVITSLDGNISLAANQGMVPTPGDFSGIDLDGSSLSSTGTGTIALSGRGGDGEGGQHGILLRGGASINTNAQNLTLSGAAPDPLSSGLRIELASLGAGGGTIQLTGNGGTTSIDSADSSATIGSTGDTLLIRSNSGDVRIVGQVQGADLQVQDHSGTESVDFALTNASNDVDRINASSNGTNGRVASLDFRDTDGFRVTEFLGASGVSASGNVTLRSNFFSGSSVVVDRPVRSAGGNVLLRGIDVVIDGTDATVTGSGSLTLEAGRAILVWDDSLLSVTNGSMRLEANRGEGSLEGNFTGITVLGSRLQSLGTGGISLSGAGGDGGIGSDFTFPGFTNPSSNGIRLDGGTVISSSDTSSGDFGIELYGDGGGGASNSVGISIANVDTILSSAGRSILVEGRGGGDSPGQRNRGILFTGGLIQAANTGNVTLFGEGGAGVNENDGIQLDGGARVQVAGGDLTFDGYAGDTLGIGVMLGNTAGNLTVTGNGTATVKGSGTNAHGVLLGNSSALVGGINADYVDVFSREGDLTVQRQIIASGNVFVEADFGDVFIEGEVNSGTGDIGIEGDNVRIDAPVTTTYGDISVTFGDNPVVFDGEPEEPLEITPVFDGTGEINNLLSAGGRVRYFGGDGTGDILTFAGFTISEIDLDIADLTAIENVVGTGSPNDQMRGPATASNYQFTGPNQFNVAGVAFSAFENVLGGGGDDVFAFTGSASIGGVLDGGAGVNRLDYSGYGTGVIVDLPLGAATGIVGGFENITNFTGSGNIDTVTGPGSASIYTFNGVDSMQVGTVSVAGFENLVAGPLEDRFVFLPGSRLRGLLDGGASLTPVNNILDYSGFGAPITVNLATSTAGNLPGGFSGINRFQGSGSTRDLFSGPNTPTNYLFAGPNSFGNPDFQATGFENLTGGANSDTFIFAPGTNLSGDLSGGEGPGSDTLTYAVFGRPVTVNIGPNTAPGIGGRFEGIERIVGSPGNDRFNFLNQSTINFVDGGTGTDLIEINDTNLRGDNTYDINANSVSRNPLYTFNNFEALRLFLGTGNNTVNSGFFPFTQFLHGGNGFNTLNLPGVTSLNGPNPVGNVHHFGFDAPRPGGVDTGGLLQLEVDQNNGGPDLNTGQDSRTENRFSIVDPGTLNSQIAALGGAFSAAVVAQAVIATVDGNSYLVLRPFSLDGSGLSPSNLGLAALNESLGVDANLELAAAIGFDGPVFLFNPDGPYSIDLSGVPADPAILTLLQESLSIAAAAELSEAIGLTLTVSITGADGIVPTGLDGSVPGQNVVLIFGDQLGDPAQAELNAAIAEGN